MGDRFQVVVNVDADVLAHDYPDGVCELADGPALAPETVRRISCDASIVEALERGLHVRPEADGNGESEMIAAELQSGLEDS